MNQLLTVITLLTAITSNAAQFSGCLDAVDCQKTAKRLAAKAAKKRTCLGEGKAVYLNLKSITTPDNAQLLALHGCLTLKGPNASDAALENFYKNLR